MSMTDDFYYMHAPKQWKGGKWSDMWVVGTVYSMGGEKFAYLYPDMKLHEYVVDKNTNEIGFFDTRLDALITIKAYYRIHEIEFPYGTELTDEILNLTLADVEPQTMEFI